VCKFKNWKVRKTESHSGAPLRSRISALISGAIEQEDKNDEEEEDDEEEEG
jgi:hypothetical protein